MEQSVDGPAPGDGPRTRTLTLRDPATGLEVRAVCTLVYRCTGVDWTLYFTNTGTADSPVLEAIRSLDVVIRTSRNRCAAPARREHRRRDRRRPLSQVADGHAVTIQPQSGRSSKARRRFHLRGRAGAWSRPLAGRGAGRPRSSTAARPFGFRRASRSSARSWRTRRNGARARILQVYWQGDDVCAAITRSGR